MRLLSLFLVAPLALLAACAAPQDEEGSSTGQAMATGSFAFTPGRERIAQHQAERAASWGAQVQLASKDLVADFTADGTGLPAKEEADSFAQSLARQRLGLDWTNAHALAQLALLAYQDEPTLARSLAELGLPSDRDHFQFFENRCTDAQGFYITNAPNPLAREKVAGHPSNAASPYFAVLAFRGTEPKKTKDLAADAYAWPAPTNLGSVHRGFDSRVASLWDKADGKCGVTEPIGSYLAARHGFDGTGMTPVRTGAELYLTGHSLGAAMATVALTRTVTDTCAAERSSREGSCFKRYTPVSGLVTFGSPRVGNQSWATGLTAAIDDRTPVYRFVHGLDIVTDVPRSPFVHLGHEGNESIFKVQIQGDGSMLVGRNGDRGTGPLAKRATDHSMVEYEAALRTPPR